MIICVGGKNLIAVQVLLSLFPRYEVTCLPNTDDPGKDGWQPSLKRVAKGLGVPIVTLEQVQSDPDCVFLSVEYANIVDPVRFKSGKLFNVHFSLLPNYRGCHTAIWPILNGETLHGVTLHEIDAGVDSGPIIAQEAFDLTGMTAVDSYMRCQQLGIKLVLDWVSRLISGDYAAIPQPKSGSCYRRNQLNWSLKEIDLSETSEQVLRKIQGFHFSSVSKAHAEWPADLFSGKRGELQDRRRGDIAQLSGISRATAVQIRRFQT